ncbi:MAG TPA: response regulator [Gammaproteobacteria bacterium]|nr:response regulator [Gammaproteobacteria bacterium]
MTKVLVIEDSPTELMLMAKWCKEAGYDAVTAATGEEGLRRAKEDRPDIILLDVVMPDRNGFQIARDLKKDQSTAGIPIIIVSTKGEQIDIMWGKKQGAIEYLVKPVNAAQLTAAIKRVLAGGATA